jgi:hypothetical protein
MRLRGPIGAVAAGLAVAALAVAAPAFGGSSRPARAADVGTLSICNKAGNPPISIALAYTSNAPAGAGGTVVQTASVGTCTARVFYTVGTHVIVSESVPTGFAVTAIDVAGGSSTLSDTVLSAGVTTVTVGTGDTTVTFTTKGPGAPAAAQCVVPRVVGLTLTAARKAVVHNHCRVGSVLRVHSKRIPKGGVTSVKPRGGTHLAHNAKVRLYVSKG